MNRLINQNYFKILLLVFLAHGTQASAKAFLSFSPHPARIDLIDRVLLPLEELILSNDIERVFINIPIFFRNTQSEIYDEDGLRALEQSLNDRYYGKVIINRFKPDLGPISKLLPTINILHSQNEYAEDSIVVTIDDDYAYSPRAIRALIAQRVSGQPVMSFGGNSINYWVKQVSAFPKKVEGGKIRSVAERSPVDLIEGWAGVAYRLSDIPPQRAELMSLLATRVSKDCYLSDDLVISYTLGLGNVEKKRLVSNALKQEINIIAELESLKSYIEKEATNLSCNALLKLSLKNNVDKPTIVTDNKKDEFFLVMEKMNKLSISSEDQEKGLKNQLAELKFNGGPAVLNKALCDHIKRQHPNAALLTEVDHIELFKQKISQANEEKRAQFFLEGFPGIQKLTKRLVDKFGKPLILTDFFFDSFIPKDIISDNKLDSVLKDFQLHPDYALNIKGYLISALQDYQRAKERSELKLIWLQKFMQKISQDLSNILGKSDEQGLLAGKISQAFIKEAPNLIEDSSALQNGSGFSSAEKTERQDNPEKARIENSKYGRCLEALLKYTYNEQDQEFLSEEEIRLNLRQIPETSFFD